MKYNVHIKQMSNWKIQWEICGMNIISHFWPSSGRLWKPAWIRPWYRADPQAKVRHVVFLIGLQSRRIFTTDATSRLCLRCRSRKFSYFLISFAIDKCQTTVGRGQMSVGGYRADPRIRILWRPPEIGLPGVNSSKRSLRVRLKVVIVIRPLKLSLAKMGSRLGVSK